MKKNNKKGFTLAELLIVVAIIAVLVAIAIPVFTSQLEKARDSTDQANIRSAYGELAVALLDGSITPPATGTTTKTYTISGKGTNGTWDNDNGTFAIGGADSPITVTAVAKFTGIQFTYDSTGKITACTLTKAAANS